MTALPLPRYTPEEYLALERVSEVKHEFFRGEMFAMAGGSEEHSLIAGELMHVLKGALRGKPCKVFGSDMRVQVNQSGLYTYPDLTVSCLKPLFGDDHVDTLLNPQVIIEVLSPSTEVYDRGKNFEHYRQLKSFQEYLLVSQDRPHIDRFVRQAAGKWLLDDARGLEGVIELETVEARIPLAEVYRQVEFDKGDSEVADSKQV